MSLDSCKQLTIDLPRDFQVTLSLCPQWATHPDLAAVHALTLKPDTKPINIYHRTRTCRGENTDALSPIPRVVFKYTINNPEAREELITEAERYVTAQSIQGDVIPKFYGLWEGSAEIDGEHFAVSGLLLDDCGDPDMSKEVYDVVHERRIAILKAVHKLHIAGLEHCDIAARNVVWKDGHPVLIDLAHSKRHVCERKIPIKYLGLAPTEEEFGCSELYSLAKNMKLWLYPTVKFRHRNVRVARIHKVEDIYRESGVWPTDPARAWQRETLEGEAAGVMAYVQWRRKYCPRTMSEAGTE